MSGESDGQILVKLTKREDTHTVKVEFDIEGHPEVDLGTSYRGMHRWIYAESVRVVFANRRLLSCWVTGRLKLKSGNYGLALISRKYWGSFEEKYPQWLVPYLNMAMIDEQSKSLPKEAGE